MHSSACEQASVYLGLVRLAARKLQHGVSSYKHKHTRRRCTLVRTSRRRALQRLQIDSSLGSAAKQRPSVLHTNARVWAICGSSRVHCERLYCRPELCGKLPCRAPLTAAGDTPASFRTSRRFANTACPTCPPPGLTLNLKRGCNGPTVLSLCPAQHSAICGTPRPGLNPYATKGPTRRRPHTVPRRRTHSPQKLGLQTAARNEKKSIEDHSDRYFAAHAPGAPQIARTRQAALCGGVQSDLTRRGAAVPSLAHRGVRQTQRRLRTRAHAHAPRRRVGVIRQRHRLAGRCCGRTLQTWSTAIAAFELLHGWPREQRVRGGRGGGRRRRVVIFRVGANGCGGACKVVIEVVFCGHCGIFYWQESSRRAEAVGRPRLRK